MMHEDGNLDAVLASPDDVSQRLMYADWLEETAPHLADFVRLQCKLSILDSSAAQRIPLELAERGFLRQHLRTWDQAIRKLVSAVEYRRGLIESIRVTPEQFLSVCEQLFDMAPIQSVTFDADRSLSGIEACRFLANLTELGFICSNGCPVGLADLLHSDFLVRLDQLGFGNNTLTWDAIEALQQAPSHLLPNRLWMRNASIGPEAVGEILGLPLFSCVTEFAVGPIPRVNTHYPIALEISPVLNRLRSLHLMDCELSARDIEELTQYCTAATLRSLRLPGNPVSWQGVRSLQQASFIGQLVELDLSSCILNARGFGLLSKLETRQLRKLNVASNLINERCGQLLAESTHLETVQSLLIDGIDGKTRQERFQLRDDGLRHLLAGNLNNLVHLGLARNGLTNKSLEYLFEWPHLEQLIEVDLSSNVINDDGARILAEHGPWEELLTLDLRLNPIEQPMRDELQATFGDKVILG